MDMVIDFEKLQDDPLIGLVVKEDIETILNLVDTQNLHELIAALNALQEKLINHCDNKLNFTGYSYAETANSYFSKFLQYFFSYILKTKLKKDLIYRKRLLLEILEEFKEDFYFHFGDGELKKISFWYDKNIQDTALITVLKEGDSEILENLLENLRLPFSVEEGTEVVPKKLEEYLFHENLHGRSALTLIWLKSKAEDREDMENCLYNFAKLYYGAIDSRTFSGFVLQIDSKKNTALMRAAERGHEYASQIIIDNVARFFGGEKSDSFKNFLLQKNEENESVLIKAIKSKKKEEVEIILKEILQAFPDVDSFIREDVDPFIEAVKVSNKEILDRVFKFFLLNKESEVINYFFRKQDAEGKTAFMYAIEPNYFEEFKYLLNCLLNFHWGEDGYEQESIIHDLFLKQVAANGEIGLNAFQLAAKVKNWQALEKLLDTVIKINALYLLDKKQVAYTNEYGVDLYTQIIQEEQEYKTSLASGESSPLQKESSDTRKKLVQKLRRLGLQSSVGDKIWNSMPENRQRLEPIVNFFGALCGSSHSPSHSASSSSSKRSVDNCFFSHKDYKVSIPADLTQQYKEALINIVAVLKQKNLESIEQISIIRNLQSPSEREAKLVELFSNRVTHYYATHAKSILDNLKKNRAESLEVALTYKNKPYILLDNEKDLLLIKANKIFSGSLLNPVKFFLLNPAINQEELKMWVDTYFGSSYKIYYFDAEFMQNYPAILEGMKTSIMSDSMLLSQDYEGVKIQTLRELFLLNSKPIELDRFTEEEFFAIKKGELSFRADRFHEIFFKLKLAQQVALKNFIAAYGIKIASYSQLLDEENAYLKSYGDNLMREIVNAETITPERLFNVAIDAHEVVLLEDTDLVLKQKTKIIAELRALKARLAVYEPEYRTKVALQLLVFLFPSGVSAIAKKDPFELATPIALMAGDSVLREILVRLVNHPQISQIFVGEVASKVLSMISNMAENIPIVGSALAVYGLVKSGKALVNTASNDPNRSYYAHLLANNLLMLGTMGSEYFIGLPFWPALLLFTTLTVDQIVSEGERVHDAVLHLEDDREHPFLRFCREIKLGLGIVDSDIRVVLEQQKLFNNFIDYLSRVDNIKGANALVAVSLPGVRQVSKFTLSAGRGSERCIDSMASSESVYPESPFCDTYRLVINKKGDYYYEIGEFKTFCEIRDPFTPIGPFSNYTLFVGSRISNCTLGQNKRLNAVAQADLDNVAGILVNSHYRESNASTKYRLFLPIDPFIVGKFDVKLLKNSMQSYPKSENLEKWLPCVNGTTNCITHIHVVVSPLYKQFTDNAALETMININDDGLRSNSAGVGVIEYLLAVTNNVRILPNKIPEKIFAFIENEHYLKFGNNKIISNNNFEVSLSGTKNLTLELTDKAWLEGFYRVPDEQILLINQLKGKSKNQSVTLDVTESNSFTVSLGQNTELRDKSINISLENEFPYSFLEVSRHYNDTTFYHLSIPMNKISVVYAEDQTQLLLYPLVPILKDPPPIITIDVSGSNYTKAFDFYGKYEYKNKIYFSRMVMKKPIDSPWQCDLEINTSAERKAEFDLGYLQSQGFSKVTILKRFSSYYEPVHYLFYQFRRRPRVYGKFISYRLLATGNGWLIVLKTAENEETRCLIGENTSEIIIENIRYLVKPGLASLFAIGTLDNSPINGENLLAPIKIDKSFFLSDIDDLSNNTYKIENITLHNVLLNTEIYFSDQTLLFAYIKYNLRQIPTRSVSPVGELTDERRSLKKRSITESLRSRLRLPLRADSVSLEGSKDSSSAYTTGKNLKADIDISQSKFCKAIENLKPIKSSKSSTDFSDSLKYTGDLNSHLFFLNYLVGYVNKDNKPIKNITAKHSFYMSGKNDHLNKLDNEVDLNQLAANTSGFIS